MDSWTIRHPRLARTLATFSILVFAITGSQHLSDAQAAPTNSAEATPIAYNPDGPLVAMITMATSISIQKHLEETANVVNVPAGWTLKKARNAWKKHGELQADEIYAEAPYEGAPRESIVDFARNFVGAPYVYSGSTPYGFDCSGYVMFIYAHFGVLLHHSAREQGAAGKRIKAKHARPGDLVIWNDGSHSAIYAGDGKILHATKPGDTVVEVDLYTDAVYYVRIPVGTSK